MSISQALKGIFLSILIFCAFANCKPVSSEPKAQKTIQSTKLDITNIDVDTFEATVADFAHFIDATKYLTTADSFQWSGIWELDKGAWGIAEHANWRKHDGITEAASNLPAVHLSYKDACAFCAWRGGRLPTAQEWDLLAGDTVIVGNVWQGLFPHVDEGLDGYKTVAAPVGSFSPSTTGLYDMFGNVWEWTSTMDPRKNERIIKGGSFLCDYNVCQGYIPSRYQTTPDDSGLSHLGVRCVYDR